MEEGPHPIDAGVHGQDVAALVEPVARQGAAAQVPTGRPLAPAAVLIQVVGVEGGQHVFPPCGEHVDAYPQAPQGLFQHVFPPDGDGFVAAESIGHPAPRVPKPQGHGLERPGVHFGRVLVPAAFPGLPIARREVEVHGFGRGAVEHDAALPEHQGPLGQVQDGGHVVADEEHGATLAGHFPHFAQAFALERGVPHGQHFVHQQDFRLQVRGHGKGQAQVHPAGVELDRGVDELLHFGKGHDFVELPVDFGPAHAQDGAAQVDVLPAGQLRVKARAHFQQGTHAAVKFRVALGGPGDPGENLEQGGLARTVVADDAHHFPGADLETDVLQGPDGGPVSAAAQAVGQKVPQGAVVQPGGLADAILLGQVHHTEGQRHGVHPSWLRACRAASNRGFRARALRKSRRARSSWPRAALAMPRQ